MTLNLDPLFQPFDLGRLHLRNRVAMAPMTRNFSPRGIPGEDVVAYYRRRAEAGIGLIITEGTVVNHPAANGYPDVPAFHGEQALAGWKQVADAVHQAGGAIFPQLWHVGAVRKEGMEPDPQVPGFSPSGLYSPGKPNGKAMTREDIRDVVKAFGQAAADARALGFDGVEIHGAHGYLLDQFLWEGTNQREDEYGGSMENRLRIVVEVIEEVRRCVGPDFPIMLRFSQWKMQDYEARLAHTPDELEAFLKPLSEAGVDIFHASTRRFWEPEFEGSNLNLAGWTQKLTGKPAMSVGSVGLTEDFISGTFASEKESVERSGLDELAERMANHEFELIAVGRALLQDPYWLQKVKDGRLDEIKDFSKSALGKLY
ncbi:2,4-dienoyl-CoA reductase [Marinobacter persicus]|uniref:2,4-dienoyl-CoA reductase n=1 Tax=Marinobacter persicus TaxID=930118 RepID=A0A1I3XQN4_9GAMM|nr:NADH:flavin oxidoreductase [Marinobacter persicus]GHD49605.1 oxidoreductase [Marinobacter persicus]SFK21306.1 2,4-dienoyl-CoA reductase [Marinobacter persicus]